MTSALTPAGSTRPWRRLRLFVLRRDGYACQVWVDADAQLAEDDHGEPTAAAVARCGAYASNVDHKRRRRHGGSDHPDNLRAACGPHNLAREGAPRRRSGSVGWSW